ncbi:MAG: FAD-binding protein [Acidobacteriota bacterium]
MGAPDVFSPESVPELADWLGSRRDGTATAAPACVAGGGTKPSLSHRDGAMPVELKHLSGILSYEPSEFTLTVRAGTALREISAALGAHGQSLPFDPPWVDAGSTAGGAVAAGISGPGRTRGGGVRDSVLAVRFLDGQGRHARAGAAVVKNAAGFDLPKLFVGSVGGLAVLTEITFKVLPAPRAHATALFDLPDLSAAHRAALSVLGANFTLDGLEIMPAAESPGDDFTLASRVGGEPASFDARLARLAKHLGQPFRSPSSPQEERSLWARLRDADWAPADRALLWVPTAPARVPALAAALRDFNADAGFGGGLTSARISIPADALDAFEAVLTGLDFQALLLRGAQRPPILGRPIGAPLLHRVKKTLDPDGLFAGFGANS